ncbi:MAG TPA: hypothetical protein VM029_02880 [Opitutaceae bacterium]|nr:hypothetical protein [Opitutaceae bacterium]
MKLIPVVALTLLATTAPLASAAINPEEFTRIASDVVRLREIARVVERDSNQPVGIQRITIVGEVVERERASSGNFNHRVIVIDYRVDLTARAAAAKKHAAANGGKPGRQFMHEPDPPTLDADRQFWAHLAPVAGRLGNVNRYAGHKVNMQSEQFAGPVFVPVAGQYSWDVPAERVDAKATTKAPGGSFTGTVHTGIMAIGGETTGIQLETAAAGSYELDTRGNPELAAAFANLDGKKAIVTGDYRPRAGVEVKERRIIVVREVRAAP